MNINFYDIESLDNVFTYAFYLVQGDKETVYLFYLLDDFVLSPTFFNDCRRCIWDTNKNFKGNIVFCDLNTAEGNALLVKFLGGISPMCPTIHGFDANGMPIIDSNHWSQLCFMNDYDADYSDDNPDAPYVMGYNSYNYDSTMSALYFYERFDVSTSPETFRQHKVTAKKMREYNDELFSSQFKEKMYSRLDYTYARCATPVYAGSNTLQASRTLIRDDTKQAKTIRRNMMMSGRHLDVARLNEKQSKVGLKRLLGMLGYQILESDKLGPNCSHIYTIDELMELFAYNVSDVVNLRKLFEHKLYKSNFDLKKGLLQTYPDLMYEQTFDIDPVTQQRKYAPDVRPDNVRQDRLMIDSSSSQFASKALCPYGHLDDIEGVSFMYPSEQKAKEKGIPRVNVLEEARKFFHNLYQDPPNEPGKFQSVRDTFDKVYNYYKSIEGKNFNDSKEYRETYPNGPVAESLTGDIPICIPYFNDDGSASSCFATFSTGGIHGAEYNKALYEHDSVLYSAHIDTINAVKQYCYNACVSEGNTSPTDNDLAVMCRKLKDIPVPANMFTAGEPNMRYTRFLRSGATLKKAEWKYPTNIRLFFDEKGKLNPVYTFTSYDDTQHEDFVSYYPNMLIMLSAFWNKGLGYDRYEEIFGNKQTYGKLMKDSSLPEEERGKYAVMREGTKLILNSASGAGDAGFYNPIRANNRIISMRLIGQLFTWRIGQAQTYRGANIISTNTDGLYSALEATLNNKILEAESKVIGVEIEPEPVKLVSKDSNNRLELKADYSIITASGGSLACYEGPNPAKALSHPAVSDYAMCHYLIDCVKNGGAEALTKPFDSNIGARIVNQPRQQFDSLKQLLLYQTVLASSVGSASYVFATKDTGEIINLQHYNRVLFVKPDTPGAVHVKVAVGKKITPAMKKTRAQKGFSGVEIDPIAKSVLEFHNAFKDIIATGEKDVVCKKITNIDETDYVLIVNNDLHVMSEQDRQQLLSYLDLDKYVRLLGDSYENNWMNTVPA